MFAVTLFYFGCGGPGVHQSVLVGGVVWIVWIVVASRWRHFFVLTTVFVGLL